MPSTASKAIHTLEYSRRPHIRVDQCRGQDTYTHSIYPQARDAASRRIVRFYHYPGAVAHRNVLRIFKYTTTEILQLRRLARAYRGCAAGYHAFMPERSTSLRRLSSFHITVHSTNQVLASTLHQPFGFVPTPSFLLPYISWIAPTRQQ